MLTFTYSSRTRPSAVVFLIMLLELCLVSSSAGAAEGLASAPLPDWPQFLVTYQDRLATVDSDQAATELFVGQIGPAAALTDVAATISAKGIPAKLAKELLVQEITRSAQRLVAALAAWQLVVWRRRLVCKPWRNGGGSKPGKTVSVSLAVNHASAGRGNGSFTTINATMKNKNCP